MPKPPKIPKENLELLTAGQAAVGQHPLLAYLRELAIELARALPRLAAQR